MGGWHPIVSSRKKCVLLSGFRSLRQCRACWWRVGRRDRIVSQHVPIHRARQGKRVGRRTDSPVMDWGVRMKGMTDAAVDVRVWG